MVDRVQRWQDTVAADLEALEQELHDAVDIPDVVEDTDPPLIDPKNRKDDHAQALEAAARAPGRSRGEDVDEDYLTVQMSSGRSSERSDPVTRETERWAAQVTHIVTQVVDLLEEWNAAATVTLAPHGRNVRDEQGRVVAPPPVEVVEDPATGRRRAACGPSNANRIIHDSITWMKYACDAIAHWWADDSHDEQLPIRAHHLAERTRHLLRRHQEHQRLSTGRGRCRNPLGRSNHPVDEDAVGGICSECLNPRHCSCGELLPIGHDRKDCWQCVNARRGTTAARRP